jgi:hypothetical protein
MEHEERLRTAKVHAALGREHVGRQKQIVLDLEQAGRDVALAKKLLLQFEELQVFYETEVGRLTAALVHRTK